MAERFGFAHQYLQEHRFQSSKLIEHGRFSTPLLPTPPRPFADNPALGSISQTVDYNTYLLKERECDYLKGMAETAMHEKAILHVENEKLRNEIAELRSRLDASNKHLISVQPKVKLSENIKEQSRYFNYDRTQGNMQQEKNLSCNNLTSKRFAVNFLDSRIESIFENVSSTVTVRDAYSFITSSFVDNGGSKPQRFPDGWREYVAQYYADWKDEFPNAKMYLELLCQLLFVQLNRIGDYSSTCLEHCLHQAKALVESIIRAMNKNISVDTNQRRLDRAKRFDFRRKEQVFIGKKFYGFGGDEMSSERFDKFKSEKKKEKGLEETDCAPVSSDGDIPRTPGADFPELDNDSKDSDKD